MKKLSRLLPVLAALAAIPAFAQSVDKPASTATATAAPAPSRTLSKFNLDFPGGTPAQLSAAIQRSLGRPLNVVVPVEWAAWKLPPLKMSNVDVAQLFKALEMAGQTREVVNSGGGFQERSTAISFRTGDPGPPNDDTVWFFYVNGSAKWPKVSRFYHLKPYIDGGLTVDDITTAIQTGWRMRGDAETPTLSFHKETKLLIAVGDMGGLDVIEQVLKALDTAKARPAAAPPADDSKTKR